MMQGEVHTERATEPQYFGYRHALAEVCPAPAAAVPSSLAGAGAIQGGKMMMFILNQLTRLHDDESGQGLVEYLLILALVAFAATAGMGSLASGLNSAFSQIGITLGKYIS
jgi:pilus assembly protein Flp/PilA